MVEYFVIRRRTCTSCDGVDDAFVCSRCQNSGFIEDTVTLREALLNIEDYKGEDK